MAFKFEWVKKNDGFDPNPATPWLMVPKDGYKEVELPGLKNSLTNFTWTCSGGISWAPSGGDRLFVFGNKKTGLFRLEARNAAGEVAKLDVSVKSTLDLQDPSLHPPPCRRAHLDAQFRVARTPGSRSQ